MVKKLKTLPQKARRILKVASAVATGMECNIYLVGGVVRDLLLDKPNQDYDIVVEGDGIEFARKLAHEFRTHYQKHHAFGTATVYCQGLKIDIASCRREYYTHWGALPKVSFATIREDLFRRDFTINAMALGLNRSNYGELIDFYHGWRDLKKKIIRVLHDKSFLDDPTRLLRAVRFEQRFSFKIEYATRRSFNHAVHLKALTFIDEQRIRDELILLLKEEQPFRCIRRMAQLLGVSFIAEKLTFQDKDFALLRRIRSALAWYNSRYAKKKKIQPWLVYLLGIIDKVGLKKRTQFCRDWGFRKNETKEMLAIVRHKKNMRRLRVKNPTKTVIYKTLIPMSNEALVFLYAYEKSKTVRLHIRHFLDVLSHIRVKVKGKDLKDLHLKPYCLYSKALIKLLHLKIERGIPSKEKELQEIKKIFERLRQRCRHPKGIC